MLWHVGEAEKVAPAVEALDRALRLLSDGLGKLTRWQAPLDRPQRATSPSIAQQHSNRATPAVWSREATLPGPFPLQFSATPPQPPLICFFFFFKLTRRERGAELSPCQLVFCSRLSCLLRGQFTLSLTQYTLARRGTRVWRAPLSRVARTTFLPSQLHSANPSSSRHNTRLQPRNNTSLRSCQRHVSITIIHP